MTTDGCDEEEDCIWRGDWLTVRAMRRTNGSLPGKEWADGLSAKGTGQLMAACQIMETSLRSSRPPAGRAEKLGTSDNGLSELRVTKPGSTAPHLRLMFIRRGQTLWVADGFTKQKNRLTAAEIAASDSVASEWLNGEGKVQ
ncbi:MAG: hypothetical protein JWL79_919 [Frankiales bacterium]|nr:hypothetical protein [Frankiales bacterium]